ncbi:anaerobic ribonucleoside-triphosphate reductase activating protein [Desulfogranum japonicum]|uniref:anaerobic ribonucleoside-triphosphate reductase activating protein n=1 Tax=Desulfogranum japonicum TaxID=231447 RepID=UPI00042207AF|nr:anaerobic ribonucleoside-triphosphate reductase activating protein [Desulfogranum japonicum]
MVIGGFHPFTLSDFPGHVAAIVFTQGCSMRCPYCHNKHLWALQAEHGEIDEEHIVTVLDKRSKRLQGVVITGGEPTLQQELVRFATRVKAMGLRVKIDTNGLCPEKLRELILAGVVDYIAMDIKAPWEKYSIVCGTEINTTRIQTSIDCIVGSGLPHHFRTTWYRQMLNDSDMEELRRTMVPPSSPYVVQKCIM